MKEIDIKINNTVMEKKCGRTALDMKDLICKERKMEKGCYIFQMGLHMKEISLIINIMDMVNQ